MGHVHVTVKRNQILDCVLHLHDCWWCRVCTVWCCLFGACFVLVSCDYCVENNLFFFWFGGGGLWCGRRLSAAFVCRGCTFRISPRCSYVFLCHAQLVHRVLSRTMCMVCLLCVLDAPRKYIKPIYTKNDPRHDLRLDEKILSRKTYERWTSLTEDK